MTPALSRAMLGGCEARVNAAAMTAPMTALAMNSRLSMADLAVRLLDIDTIGRAIDLASGRARVWLASLAQQDVAQRIERMERIKAMVHDVRVALNESVSWADQAILLLDGLDIDEATPQLVELLRRTADEISSSGEHCNRANRAILSGDMETAVSEARMSAHHMRESAILSLAATFECEPGVDLSELGSLPLDDESAAILAEVSDDDIPWFE